MSCVEVEALVVSTDVLYVEQKRTNSVSNAYHVDFWRELRKRWMVLGVLCAVALAVLSPRLGAAGGALHTQYLCYIPLWHIYYSAGLETNARELLANVRGRTRVIALSCVHAHVVGPALCAVVVTAFRDGVDYRIVKGVMLSSVCGGCGWLSLSLCGASAAPACAASYVVSLLAAPLLCGISSAPSLRAVLPTAATTVIPFVVGAVRPTARRDPTATRLSALSLVYAECCQRLSDAAGILHVSDVLVTLSLVLCWAALACACSALYARGGALCAADAALLRATALPKALHYWRESASCSLSGLSRLPAAFLAPTHALIMAALEPDDAQHEDTA